MERAEAKDAQPTPRLIQPQANPPCSTTAYSPDSCRQPERTGPTAVNPSESPCLFSARRITLLCVLPATAGQAIHGTPDSAADEGETSELGNSGRTSGIRTRIPRVRAFDWSYAGCPVAGLEGVSVEDGGGQHVGRNSG